MTVSQRLVTIENMDNLFVEQLRSAIRESEMSLGSIAQSTAIDKAVLSRFMNGKSGLSVTSIDRLCTVLGLRLVSEKDLSKRRKRRKMIEGIVSACIDQIHKNSPYCAVDATRCYHGTFEGVILVEKPCLSGQKRFICRIDFNVAGIEIYNYVTPGTPIPYYDPNMLGLMLKTIEAIATK